MLANSHLVTAEMSGTKQTVNKYEDLRFWKPTVDESGNGFAQIRFLPQGEGQDSTSGKILDHFFKAQLGSGMWRSH